MKKPPVICVVVLFALAGLFAAFIGIRKLQDALAIHPVAIRLDLPMGRVQGLQYPFTDGGCVMWDVETGRVVAYSGDFVATLLGTPARIVPEPPMTRIRPLQLGRSRAPWIRSGEGADEWWERNRPRV